MKILLIVMMLLDIMTSEELRSWQVLIQMLSQCKTMISKTRTLLQCAISILIPIDLHLTLTCLILLRKKSNRFVLLLLLTLFKEEMITLLILLSVEMNT
jgi:hypothetical protein